jgi:DNA-binding transcriptional ArsR family regulator
MDKSVSKELFKRCDEVAYVMASLSHPTRLKVLCSLMNGEKTVGELTHICEISQPAMSQFLNRMKNDGMITSRKEGQKAFYNVSDKKLLKLLAAIKESYCG